MELETGRRARAKFERKSKQMIQRLQDAGMAFGIFDCDCLGAHTRVLTDNGWKRIINVSIDDRLWDGDEWVSHDGLIYRGISETISFRGISVTPDHKILQNGEWIEAKFAETGGITTTGEPTHIEGDHATGKQAVYDLLNAGARNRFAVCGADGVPFIVHNCACAAAPNYQPTADATKESAQIMADLGREQLAESKRQYDNTTAISKPVVDAQLGIMQQTQDQGGDYYDYMKGTFRPVEQAAALEAMGLTPDQIAQYNAIKAEEAAAHSAAIASAPQSAPQPSSISVPTSTLGWETGAVKGSAIPVTPAASLFGGQRLFGGANAGQNILSFMQGNGLPKSPSYDANAYYVPDGNGGYRLAQQVATQGQQTVNVPGSTSPAPSIPMDTSKSDAFLSNASAGAGQRKQEEKAGKAIADVRSGTTSAANMMMRQGIRYGLSPEQIAARAADTSTNLASAEVAAGNDARLKEEATGWAKKLDVAGLGRGLPGASQGAYSLAVGAGDSAVKNTMGPSQALLTGNAAGVGTIGAGQDLSLRGNLGILNAQTSFANSENSAMNSGGGSGLGGLGSLLGGAAALYTASSKKIKKNKQDVSPVLAGIKKLNVQQWDYKDGEGDGGTHVGPYAEDVNQEFGEQAAPGGKAVDIISMMGINIKATQELANKVDSIERQLSRGRVIDGKATRIEEKSHA